MKYNKKRIIMLDYIRTMAIMLVFLNHAISTFYVDQLNPSLFNSISIQSKAFMVNSYIISRLGIPLFLFLTGVLILNKKFDNIEDIKKFYKKNLLSLIISVIIWNIIYYFINIQLTNDVFSFKDLLYIVLFLKKSVYGHMWYMPMIIGMYLYLPFVSMIVKKFDIKTLKIPIIISLIVFFVNPYISIVLNQINSNIYFKTIFDTSFSGAQYGLYIIFGYYIYKKQLFNKLNINVKNLLIVICYILSVFLQIFLYETNATSIVYYNFIGILIFSALIFSILINKKYKENRIVEYISKNSIGIFFIHFPVLILLSKYLVLEINRPLSVILYYILAFIITILINEILKLFKVTRKYLLRQN